MYPFDPQCALQTVLKFYQQYLQQILRGYLPYLFRLHKQWLLRWWPPMKDVECIICMCRDETNEIELLSQHFEPCSGGLFDPYNAFFNWYKSYSEPAISKPRGFSTNISSSKVAFKNSNLTSNVSRYQLWNSQRSI